ncbi:hypothetical protein BJF79_31995 [Actinomadura sp. CNU-125]|nr:hypothetical protein BJF79_31995 [Actinomadura sp. CNU-125]
MLLDRSGWPDRSPRAALALWQAVVHTAGFAVVGAFLVLAAGPLGTSYRHGMHIFLTQVIAGEPLHGLGAGQLAALVWALTVTAWLVALLARTALQNAIARNRHRGKVDLLAERPTRHHGVHLLEHPAAIAYCLPGRRSRVVISSGLVELLDTGELAAVLDHERAHARGRHHLLLLPLHALARAVPWLPVARLARDNSARLVEMLADDHARHRHGGHVLARALLMVAAHRTGRPPACALGIGEHAVIARVRRLTEPAAPVPRWQRLLAYLGSAALLACPAAVLVPCLS